MHELLWITILSHEWGDFPITFKSEEVMSENHWQIASWVTQKSLCLMCLIHWGRVTHICISKLTGIVSYNGLSPGRRQAIIWTNAGIWLIEPLGTNFSEILIEIFYQMSWTHNFAKTIIDRWFRHCR